MFRLAGNFESNESHKVTSPLNLSYMYFTWDCVLDTAICGTCVSLLGFMVSWESQCGCTDPFLPPLPSLTTPHSPSIPLCPLPKLSSIPCHCVRLHRVILMSSLCHVLHPHDIHTQIHVHYHIFYLPIYIYIYTHHVSSCSGQTWSVLWNYQTQLQWNLDRFWPSRSPGERNGR